MANTLTSSVAVFEDPGHVGSYWQLAHRRENSSVDITTTGTTIAAEETSTLRIIGDWDLYTYGIWTTTLYLEKKDAAGAWEVVRSWKSNDDRNVIANGTESEETEFRLRIIAGSADLASGGYYPRFILEAADSKIFGLVKINSVTSSTVADVTIVNPVQSTDATTLWTEGAFSAAKGFPRTVTGYGGRAWYAGTSAVGNGLWGSVSNDYNNFRRSTLDDSSLAFAPSAQERNEANWLASQGETLIMGTSGEEWTIHGDGKPITPTNFQIERQSKFGSAYLPAQLVDESIVFTQRGNRKMRRIAARSDADSWSAPDLTVLAEHVTVSGIIQTAFASNPHSILWCVTADGRLLGMTYETEQNVFGWHVHNTDGLIESVAVIYGGEVDEVWLTVLRSGRRTVERLDSAAFGRVFDAPEALIYVDGAKTYDSGSPVTSVTGLDHFDGKSVSILADGADYGLQTVVSGTVTISPAATKIIVGLPFTSELQPMPIDVPLEDGSSQHRRWRISRVGLYLHDSLGGEIADAPDHDFEPLVFRDGVDNIEDAPPLFTGHKDVSIQSSTRDEVEVIVRTAGPYPLNIGALTVKGDIYGE